MFGGGRGGGGGGGAGAGACAPPRGPPCRGRGGRRGEETAAGERWHGGASGNGERARGHDTPLASSRRLPGRRVCQWVPGSWRGASASQQTLTARWVFPVSSPPLPGGVVVL